MNDPVAHVYHMVATLIALQAEAHYVRGLDGREALDHWKRMATHLRETSERLELYATAIDADEKRS